jgi:flagellar hook-length control protein FliK
MMLNNMLLSLQSTQTGSPESTESSGLSGLLATQSESDSPFAALLSQSVFSLADGSGELDLAALLNDLAEQMGKILPVSEDGELSESVSFSDELPSDLQGEELLAFLMANAGQQVVMPQSIDADALIDSDTEEGDEPLLEVFVLVSDSEGLSDECEADLDTEANVNTEPEEEPSDDIDVVVSPATEQPLPTISNPDDDDETTSEASTAKTSDNTIVFPTLNIEGTESETDDIAEAEITGDMAQVEMPEPLESAIAPPQPAGAAMKAATDVAANPVVVAGEIKPTLSDKPKPTAAMNPLTDAVASASQTDTDMTDRLQAAVQSQTAETEPVDIDTDALLDKTLKPVREGLDAKTEQDSRSMNMLETAGHRQAVKANPPTVQIPAALAQQLNRPMHLDNSGQALTERITTMLSHDIKQAVIQLDPAELGHLEIRLHLHNDQTQVQIVTTNHQARDALEAQAARLRESLNNQGLDLAQLDVSDQPSRDTSEQQSEQRQEGSDNGDIDGEEIDVAVIDQYKVGLVDQFI